MQRIEQIEVDGGAVPTDVQGPDDPSGCPAVVVVPSIYGPAPDLLARLGSLVGDTLVVVPDPFWRTGEGWVTYGDVDTAIGRLGEFDVAGCFDEMAAVVSWAKGAGNGHVVAVGICFGGPYVLRLAAAGLVDGVVTWHGSRMEQHLQVVPDIACPVRHHLGADDPVTPPEVVDALREAFADHPDAEVVVHPGATHGFSHDGDAWDAAAHDAGFASLVELLDRGR